MGEILKQCPVSGCNELIPLDAETCGKPVCSVCRNVHTEWRKGQRKAPENAKHCKACKSDVLRRNGAKAVVVNVEIRKAKKARRQAAEAEMVALRKPLPVDHLNPELLRLRMMKGAMG